MKKEVKELTLESLTHKELKDKFIKLSKRYTRIRIGLSQFMLNLESFSTFTNDDFPLQVNVEANPDFLIAHPVTDEPLPKKIE